MSSSTSSIFRVANASGFYGDRLSAAKEMVEGGPIDVLTGDYLAELTLAILHKDRQKDPSLGYARTFLRQLEQIATVCLDKGIKIVVNAGGLNPASCADACRNLYERLGLEARVAHITGDDLLPQLEILKAQGESFTHLDKGVPLTELKAPVLSANAYLGGWGIAKALDLGADLVICPRVTDASLVVGPAAWRFGWNLDDWNRLASAVVAGHILECGAQATGGNYAHFRRLGHGALQQPGFPIAEIEEEGSFTITKHPDTGGEVSIGTVTAQLLYEIDAPRYKNPDVTARFDTLRLREDGPDRVRVEGVQGEPPPPTSKVCLNHHGGFKNSVTFLLGGLDVEAKAELATDTFWTRLGGRQSFAETRTCLHRAASDAKDVETSSSFLTLAAKDPNARKVGRRFSSTAVEMALASYPGFNLTAPPGNATPFAVYWPALVTRERVPHRVVFEGENYDIPHPPAASNDVESRPETPSIETGETGETGTGTKLAPLGQICGARSGDKGGNANLGLWAETEAAYTWLVAYLTRDRLRELIPEAKNLPIDRHLFPNLKALNFVLKGYLGDGVAASLAIDAQAKGLGEYVRAKQVRIPIALLSS